jgi:hypothetical protein
MCQHVIAYCCFWHLLCRRRLLKLGSGVKWEEKKDHMLCLSKCRYIKLRLWHWFPCLCVSPSRLQVILLTGYLFYDEKNITPHLLNTSQINIKQTRLVFHENREERFFHVVESEIWTIISQVLAPQTHLVIQL